LTNGSQEGGSAKFEPKNDLDFTDDFTEKTMKKKSRNDPISRILTEKVRFLDLKMLYKLLNVCWNQCYFSI